ncbi:MAG: ribonuclease Z [Acidimicrobiia bacterium]|nr:ribonuclease Z [Acidimicrobiia bacterium]
MTGNRALTVLGTASQAPTRKRAAGGYALRWDDQLILFDPAEGFQRQCLLAGVPIGRATAVCITHFHGDHCLGLPGIIQRRALSQCEAPLPVFFPAAGSDYVEHLVRSSIYDGSFLEPRPVTAPGFVADLGGSSLLCEPLAHEVPTIGYRVQEPSVRGLSEERLHQRGLSGPIVGELIERGFLDIDGERVTVAELTEERPGQAMAFVMDTGWCNGALALAHGVDLLVCEATYLERDRSLAGEHHLTAKQAATLAADAGARRLVLSHFSSRYEEWAAYEQEASAVFDDVIIAEDLIVVPVPPRERCQDPLDG